MSKQLTRKEYIESELGKWKESYEVGFEQEFDLKLMLDLQYQVAMTPREHIKTIGDFVHTKNQIMKNLNLKPKIKTSTYKHSVLLKVENSVQVRNITDLLERIIPKKSIVEVKVSPVSSSFETENLKLNIVSMSSNTFNGMRADYIFEVNPDRSE